MAETSRLENQLSQLTEQLAQLNTTTKEQFRKSKMGERYNPFSSEFSAPAYSPSSSLDGDIVNLSKSRIVFNPFTHNRFDDKSIESSRLVYASPQDRV